MPAPATTIKLCGHCGNRAPHRLRLEYAGKLVYDVFGGEPAYEPYFYAAYSCETCQGLTLFGSHRFSDELENALPPALFPRGPNLDPPAHTVPGLTSPIPHEVRRAFIEAWPLRHVAPTAFANQIRRALEFICDDRGADGRSLHARLADLEKRGVFPPGLAEIANLLREVGNLGSHAASHEFDPWDAELIEELFRAIIEYVYVGPARIARLKQRMGT